MQQIEALLAKAKIHTTPCGDGDLVWYEWGQGEPLLLLHGGFGSWLHWFRNIDYLAQRFKVYAIDLPGLGASDMPPEPASPQSLARIIAAGLDRLEPQRPVHIAGFSFGGMLAGVLAVQLDQRAKTCVLVGAAGTGLRRPEMTLIRRNPTMSAAERRAAHDQNLKRLMIHRPENIDELALNIHAANDRQARFRSRRLSLTDALARTLADISARLIGIWGSHDATAAPWVDERRKLLQAHQPGAMFYELDAGHWVQYEAADEFNPLLAGVIDAR